MILDKWQEEFINYKGNKILVAGRQTGKSEAQAYDNAQFAVENEGVNCLLISKTQRQSEELLIKTLMFLQEKYPKRIGTGQKKPLKQTVWIKPKTKKGKWSRVMCQPTGLAGEGIRSYTIHRLSVDESQLVSDAVMTAVTPMLLTTGGSISLTGTPRGKNGFFWKAFENKLGQFKVFHVSSLEVIENRPISPSWPEWRRQAGFDHLAAEKERMTSKQFMSEYEGVFVEDLDQVFSDLWINEVCVGKRMPIRGKTYLGVDVGRTTDPSTFEIIDKVNNSLRQTENITRKELTIPDTSNLCLDLDKKNNFQKMGIDGGGLGAGVVDLLMLQDSWNNKQRVVDLNNASRIVGLDNEKEQRSKLLKEQMYLNLLSLGVQKRLTLLDDDEIKASLRSCVMEWNERTGDLWIHGSDTHITEGIIRSAWVAEQDKGLNLW